MACRLATRIEEARSGRGEDRVALAKFDGGVLVVVADGAGGVGRGAQAADAICLALQHCVTSPADWSAWLSARDRELVALGGQAAAVVLEVRNDGTLRGASVGDCEARIIDDGRVFALTDGQRRKPLLGDGHASAVTFAAHLSGRLVIATDGLWRYTKSAYVIEAGARDVSPEHVAGALVDGVRLPSGALQDDVAVVVCERAA